MSIVVLGTVALDTVRTPHGLRKNLLGGSATHFSMSSRFFTDVHLAAVVGRDFPKEHMEFFKNKKINVNSIQIKEGCTFRWEGEYKKGALNSACTLNTQLGVITTCIPRFSASEKNIKNVFLANYDPEIQIKFLSEFNNPSFIGLDTMNLWIHNKQESLMKLVKKAHIFFLNDTEARDLSGEHGFISAAKKLASCGPRMIIIKKGEHGCFFYSKDFMFSFPAYPVENVVDPTGAGDTFAGGVMGYLARSRKINEKILRKALAYGTIFSSFNVEGFGADRTSNIMMSNVEKRLKIFKKFMQF